MKKVIVLLIAMLLISLNSPMADETKNWETTLNEYINEYISEVTNLACIEKRSQELKKCNIPADKCKRFATLVAKNCLGNEIAVRRPIKHPRNMTQEELLTVIDKAAICAGRTIPVITYYVCPEQHERSWAGSGGYKWQGDGNR